MSDSNISNSALDLSQRFALDTQGFDALRAKAAASPQAGLKMAAQQFDAVFTQMMLKSMRDATPSDDPLESNDTKQFTSMLDQQLSQQMSSKGIGIADQLFKQLMRNSGMQGGAGHEGDAAALTALSKAFANPSANGALAAGQGYTRASALAPQVQDNDTTAKADPSKVDAFVDKLATPAQAASDATGIPARFILGQAALESNWGKSEIRKGDGSTSHNVFGIKATKGWMGKTASTVTTEYVDGQPQHVVQKFRAYDSYDEAMNDYANMLKNNPRYASVVSSRDVHSFAQGMQQSGYATDPHYAKKLISIVQDIG